MANFYTGTLAIEPALNPQEYEFLCQYWTAIQSFHKKYENKDPDALTQLANALGIPLEKEHKNLFFSAYSAHIEITPTEIRCLPVWGDKSFLKQSLEALYLFFFKEQMLVDMLGLDYFQPHGLTGVIEGKNSALDTWLYQLHEDKIYNIEEGERIFKPRIQPKYLNSWEERIFLLKNLKNRSGDKNNGENKAKINKKNKFKV